MNKTTIAIIAIACISLLAGCVESTRIETPTVSGGEGEWTLAHMEVVYVFTNNAGERITSETHVKHVR